MDLLRKMLSSPSSMLKVSIALCYMALGGYLLLRSDLLSFVDRAFRPVLAVLFLAYGGFRLFRAVNDLRNE